MKFTPLLQVKSKVPIVWPGHIYTFCLWQVVKIFMVNSYDPKLKALFFIFQNRERFLRKPQKKNNRKRWVLVIKTTNCRPCDFYTFFSWQMFEIFMVHSQDPKLKKFFSFFKILIRFWDTRVQSYPTSARKIFGVAKKRRVPAEKYSNGSIKRLICLKQKHWSKRWVLGTSNRCPDHLSKTIPDHRLYLSIQL